MGKVKPNEFPLRQNLDGSEELYTQTNGINEKFTVGQIWDDAPPTTEVITLGDTIINNDIVNISSGTTLVSGGTTNITGGTIITGTTSSVVDNGNGTFTHNNNDTPNVAVVIKPQDYSTSELATGQLWINGKPIYRLVVALPQWTLGTESSGSVLISAGKLFEDLVRLDFFASEDGGDSYRNLNIGDGNSWSGGGAIFYDTTDTYIIWDNFYTPSDITSKQPTVTIILEYTKP